MVNLLTQNGIPPQLVGKFSAAQQESMTAYAADRSRECYDPSSPYPFTPFAQQTQRVIEHFEAWGTKVGRRNLYFDAKELVAGDTTFTNDFNLHADAYTAPHDMNHNNKIILRTLCVSSIPASFVGLTDRDDMSDILDRYRISDSRVYEPDLLSKSEDIGGKIITPDCWETIVFDGITPHLPKGADVPHRRILMTGWIEMELPHDWKARIQNNDAPQWMP